MKQPFLIILLLISIGVNAYFLIRNIGDLSPSFVKPTDITVATTRIQEYRAGANDATELIWYSDKEIRGYLTNFYDKWMANSNLPPNMEWVVGFYPMNRTSATPKGSKHDFFVIPCIKDNVNNTILDFRDPKILTDYYSKNPLFKNPSCVGCIAYDAGQLWP